ncbi:MAG: serine/threonine protein phosphatase [Rhodospirillaceae bacterium]|jgi:anti-sigma regulatory factor (Ser/Thr protein kinase)|nr:serine/threonine protein phosphatase [Rhodospirillaceae bacterium]|tara:strand:+ start:979 stop:1404 length:426 start_codon:yes stop_codon:yes gene_type:complete
MSEMPQAERLLELTIPARPDRLRFVRHAMRDAAELCGSSGRTAEDIVIAVNEACMNIIQHGYAGRDGTIIVTVDRHDDQLDIRLTDFCAKVDPAKLKSRDLDDIRPGGLGIHLIGETMDETRFLTPPPGAGNVLQMIKKIV